MQSPFEPGSAPSQASILIVEDEGLIARDLENRVRKAGYTVAGIVDTGIAALEAAAETLPDLVLMDIRLRGELDGIETARILVQRHNVPIIYLTAHSDRETLERAKITGPFAYLTKPVSAASISASIEIALYKHRIDRETRQQRAWLRTVLQTMADGVIVTDQLGHVQYLNPAGERLTGWSPDEALNRPLSHVLRLFNLEPRDCDGLLLAGLLDERSSSLPPGIKLITRAGATISVEGEISPSLDDGASVGAVITFRDTTVREERERERRLAQRMQTVGMLASGVAHDFNNLLTVILGHASLLLSGENPGTKTTRKAIEEIEKAGTAAAAITGQLLAFSNNQIPEPRIVNLNAIVRDNEALCRSMLATNIEWRTALNREIKPVLADPGQLAQVLMNLVVNARDAMSEGGTLTVTTENVVTPATDDPDAPGREEFVMLSVADTGTGIEASIADHMFEPFFTTKPVGHGLGLGLSIVDTIVNGLGGKISVDSTPGVGSTFFVFLPIEQSTPDKPEQVRNSREGTSEGPATILLVDDDESVRDLMAKCLERTGYVIFEAGNGAQALALAASHGGAIDVLITDVMMPTMDGFSLAEQLIRVRPNVKTLFVSGYAGNPERQPHLPTEARFLQKPFVPDALLAQVGELISSPACVPSA